MNRTQTRNNDIPQNTGGGWGKLLALIPFSIGVSLIGSSFRNAEKFETLNDVAMTGAFVLFWFALTVWLWSRNWSRS